MVVPTIKMSRILKKTHLDLSVQKNHKMRQGHFHYCKGLFHLKIYVSLRELSEGSTEAKTRGNRPSV